MKQLFEKLALFTLALLIGIGGYAMAPTTSVAGPGEPPRLCLNPNWMYRIDDECPGLGGCSSPPYVTVKIMYIGEEEDCDVCINSVGCSTTWCTPQ
ncbi:MAG: hypothetical protein P1R58_06565 [bacterium]|nr:hypothetical protein [bacterium]